MFIPFFLTSPGPTTLTPWGHIIPPTSIIGALSHPYAQPPMGYGLPQGGANTSSTLPPPGSMYPGYDMPPPFAQPPAYLNVSQTNHYLYLQPGVPAPPAYALPSPLPPPNPQQHLQPPPGQVFAQQGTTNPPSSQRRWRGNPNQSAPGTRGPNPQGVDPNTANQQQGTQPKSDRPLRTKALFVLRCLWSLHPRLSPLTPDAADVGVSSQIAQTTRLPSCSS